MYSLPLWLALGAFGMALGCEFGGHLAPSGLPVGPLGVPWDAQDDFLGFVQNQTSNSEQMCLIYRAGAKNLASHYSPVDPANHTKWHMDRSSQPPFLTPGARMT